MLIKRNSIILCSYVLLFYMLTGCTSTERNIDSYISKEIESRFIGVKQSESNSCGAAVLSSVITFNGGRISESDILISSPPEDSILGYSVSELKSISIKHGYKAFAFSGSVEVLETQITNNRLPIVALSLSNELPFREIIELNPLTAWIPQIFEKKYNHFVVVVAINKENVIYFDPAKNDHDIKSIKEFVMAWGELNNATVLILGKNKTG